MWNRQHDLRIKSIAKIDWWFSMELSHTLCQCWSRNHHRKLSHCRTRNHLWNLSRGLLMESTTNTNSRLTHEINREVESSLTHGIASESASLLTRNRQRKDSRCRSSNHNWNLSDSWHVESTARPTHQIDSKNRLMIQYGIVTHTLPMLIKKSSLKTESL